MKLIYRGLTYDYDPAKRATRRPFGRTHISQTAYELIYRGHKYELIQMLSLNILFNKKQGSGERRFRARFRRGL
jgi:Domain of unknown function (DUF4278)